MTTYTVLSGQTVDGVTLFSGDVQFDYGTATTTTTNNSGTEIVDDTATSRVKQESSSTVETREIAFIDPGISDLASFLAGLRPEVEAIVLDARSPVPTQIAQALKSRGGLEAVHVVAHGCPGELWFAAGCLSLKNLGGYSEELGAIGKALAGGDLQIWSCHTAQDEDGANFIEAIQRATGAHVAASRSLIGAEALGGQWELDARESRAQIKCPLTREAITSYAGLMATKTWIGPSGTAGAPTSGNWNRASNWSPASVPAAGDDVVIDGSGTYTVTLNVSPPNLNSLRIADRRATLAIGISTLNVTGTSGTAINVTAGQITIAGGQINDTGGLALALGSGLTGRGTVAASLSGSGSITASGGTLDLTGTVNGPTLAIATGSASDLKIDGTVTAPAISINNANQTLEVGAAGTLTLTGLQTVSLGKIKLDGGALTDTSGITLGRTGNDGFITGFGKVAAAVSHGGTGTASSITATGGTLEVTGRVTGINTLKIGSGASDRLLLDAASSATAVTFAGSQGILELNTNATLTVSKALAIGANTVKLDGPGTTQLTDANGITLAGGTLSGAGTVSGSTNITGSGTVSIPLTNTDTISARGGTLDLTGTVNGPTLAIATGSASDLKIDGTVTAPAISINNANQTLEVGAAKTLTLTGLQTVSLGKIKLDGGALTDTSGITLGRTGNDGFITGFGKVAAAVSHGGTGTASSITATGGTLEVTGPVTSINTLQINNGAKLELDAASTATAVALFGSPATLELNTNATLALTNGLVVGPNNTVKLDGAGTTQLTDANGITLAGGTLSGTGTVSGSTNITGSGTVSIPLTNAETIAASGGTLDLTGTVSSGPSLQIDSTPASVLKIDGTATAASVIAISSANQTLEIGAGGNLTINAAESITNGTIQLDGGTLSDASGLTIGSGATLTGSGTVGAVTLSGGTITQTGGGLNVSSLTGYGTVNGSPSVSSITASGGQLEFKGSIDTAISSTIDIANVTGSDLKFDAAVGTAAVHPTVTFDGTNGGLGVLDLTSSTLANFHGVIANFGNGEGIMVTNAASVSLDSTGTLLTVYDSSDASLGTLTLATSYTGYQFSVSNGTISALMPDTLTTLATFNGSNGAVPVAGLISDAAGDLFGTTGGGGANGDGTVFELVNTGTVTAPVYSSTPTTLVSFSGSNGAVPLTGLISNAAGDLFGTTVEGGAAGVGTVFELVNTGTVTAPVYSSTPTTLVSFFSANVNGQSPEAGLISDAAGDLFGTTVNGGNSTSGGTVFELVNTGTVTAPVYSSTPTTLVSFSGSNGFSPTGGLIRDAVGDLFGTTVVGGANGDGTVFELVNTGTVTAPVYSSTPTTLVSFNGSNGATPTGLISDAAGDLFGTTQAGGANGDGTVFELVNTGTVTAPVYSSTPTTLVSFNGSNGAVPIAGLIRDAAGDLFGTTQAGGANGDGTVFELVNTGTVTAPVYSSTPTTLLSFNGSNGANPTASLTVDATGDLLGTTQRGGATGNGTVFEISNSGFQTSAFTTLATFNGSNGANPGAVLTRDAAGDLFGTTNSGGATGEGTVFEIANTGTVTAPVYSSTPTTLVSFNGSNGAVPVAGLISDAAGDLFGTTRGGGANGDGTVFELVNTGTVTAPVYSSTPTTLVSFSGSNGAVPLTGLISNAAGDLFGTTVEGGAAGVGTVFELVNTGTVTAPVYSSTPTTLVSFFSANVNGQSPEAGLISDAAGDLFGTTVNGGNSTSGGTVFELVNTGTVTAPVYSSTPTTLVSFSGSNGFSPTGGLIRDAVGDLFGTTVVGGANGDGTVFELVNTGTVTAPVYSSTPTTLVSFNGSNGATPTGLISDAAGDLFGTTQAGGANGDGTVFELVNTGTVTAPVYSSTPTTLLSFNGSNGATPTASLTVDATGDLLGTTQLGGATGNGTVFEIVNAGLIQTSAAITISGTQQVELFGPSSDNVTFAPSAQGTLLLDASTQFTGTVAGLNSTAPLDTLDLADISYSSNTTVGYAANATNTGGTLTVSDGTNIAKIALLGQYSASSFVASSDGHGGTAVVDPSAIATSQTPTLTQPTHA